MYSLLDESGVDPSRLVLEVTESALLDEHDGTGETIRAIKAMGVRIALDDFGTGYSSLNHLRRYPIDVLKIDRSFIASLDASRDESALVRSILRLGETLHLQVIAEGIETEAQLERLRALGGRLGQGHMFHAAMPAAALTDLVAPTRSAVG